MSFFRKNKNRKPLAVLILLLIVVGVGYFFFKDIKKASAEWFDSNWFYRQAITITVTSSASDVSNLDTWFSMDTSTPITASKMQSDCDDIRFTNANGKLLPYYIDSGCNTTTTKIWVKADLVPKNSTTYTVYAYYGNPNAVANSDSTKFNLYNSLEGYWNMNESAWAGVAGEVKDMSINANNGVRSGDATTTTGKYGRGGTLDGTGDYVDLGSNTSLRVTTQFTIGAWIKANADVTTYRTIFAKGSWTTGAIQLLLEQSTGKLFFEHNDGSAIVRSSTALNDNVWHHVVGTYDTTANEMKVYVDGVLEGTETETVDVSSTALTNYVGIRSDGLPFIGLIDDLRVYSRALSASEVSQLYNDGTSSILTAVQGQAVPSVAFATEEKGPAPVAYWKFDEGQGQTAYDDSTNNNDGTLGSAAGSDTNDPAWITGDQCISGKCLKFDGTDDYVLMADSASLQISGNITMSAWVKTGNITNNSFIFGKGTDGSKGYVLKSEGDGFYAAFTDTLGARHTSPGYTHVANTWYYVAATYDGSSFCFYVNGVSVGSCTSTSTTISTDTSQLKFGINSAGGNLFLGFIDDPKIYNYARTAAQIKSDYASRGSTSGVGAQIGNQSAWIINGLVGYWKMDEASWSGAAGEVLDASGAGNNGVRAGNATTAAGKFGNGGSLDGTGDYVNAGNNSSLNFTTSDFTISVWLKATDAGGTVIERGLSQTDGYSIMYDPYFHFLTHQSGAYTYCRSQTAVSTTAWQHWVAVRQGANMRLYLNGKEDTPYTGGDCTAISNPVTSTRNFNIGTGNTWGDTAGTTDEVRVYNRALSVKEIVDLYSFAPGPVGYWKMDEKVSGNSQTLVDSSTYGNTGTTYYGANLTGMNCKIIGRYGGGCSFDGVDDYVDAGNSSSLNITGDLTIEGWFRADTIGKFHTLVSKGADLAYNFRIRDTNLIQFYVEQSTGVLKEVTTTDTISANIWYHLVGVAKAGEALKIYINGALNKTGETHTDTKTAAANLRIGSRSDGWASGFTDGILDEVRIYNYARTQKQIAEDMLARQSFSGGGAGGSGYAAYWKFDEGYGNPKDQSVNANTATNNGASWTNSGKFGKALSFDGLGSYVSAGSPASLDDLAEISWSYWIRPTALPASYAKIIDKSWKRDRINSDGTFQVDITTDTTSASSKISGISTGTWQHIAMTYSNSGDRKIRIYKNGVEQTYTTQTAATGTLSSEAGNNLLIGNDGGANFLSAIVDEVKIYPFALTADDIKTEYNRGSAMQMGSLSDTSGLTGGSVASNSASALYCIPGDTSTCTPPVGEWNFNDYIGTSANDTSGNNNVGTLGGGTAGYRPTWKSSGSCKSGSCLSFDGTDDYVEISAHTNPTAAITVEAWAKSNTANWDDTGWVASKRNAYIMHPESGTKDMYFYIYTTGWTAAVFTLTDITSWHHYVGTYDGSNVKLYVDGQLKATNPLTGAINADTGALYIGADDGQGRYGNGFVDDVKIFNYARTAAQIAWAYNRGKPVGWWKFDECQGLTAYDSSGNANTGTITIGATIPQSVIGTCLTPTNGTGAWYNGRTGKMNSSLSFDGVDDYVDAGNGTNLNFTTQDFSIEWWINPSSIKDQMPVSRGLYLTDGYYAVMNSNGQIGLTTQVSGTQTQILSNTSQYAAGSWQHFVVTKSGSVGRVYKNGVELSKSTNESLNNPTTSTRSLLIGDYNGGGSWDLNGLLDDVKIFNYAMTPAQIKLEYNQSSAVRFGPASGRP